MKNFMSYDFVIVKTIIACYIPAGTGVAIHNNRPSHGLAIYLGGDRTFVFGDGNKLHAKRNTIVYLPKGSNYVVQTKERSDCYAINFDIDQEVDFKPFAFEIKNMEYYLELFKSSQKHWAKRETGYLMKVKSNLYDIIYNMQLEYSNLYTKGPYSKIRPAVDYIHSNYLKENISVSYLAEICNMSEVYLRSLFVKHFNLSPNKYIKKLKMKRAAELLISGFHKANEVCFLAGFSDESHFSREFKKYHGKSPLEYAKSSRQ